MPVVSDQVVSPLTEETFRVSLEPAQALFYDLVLLDKVDALPGVDPWVERTARSLSEERRQLNHTLINGLYYALLPRKSYPDFPAYIEDVRSQDPGRWIDRLFEAYERVARLHVPDPEELSQPNREVLLADLDSYLNYLEQRFDPKYVDEEVERQAHAWLNEPVEMQATASAHLEWMWTEHLDPAWEKALPLLEDSVEAFRQVEWPGGSPLEIARWVIGHEVKERHQRALENAERVVFVPSTHVGPYTLSCEAGGTLWVAFGARVPAGSRLRSAALSRAQMLVRLGALADENRLHILDLLRQEGELCAQDIIERLDLSQSSVSRHLRQLTSSGHLLERRQESAKCYRLSPKGCERTVAALAEFLDVDCE